MTDETKPIRDLWVPILLRLQWMGWRRLDRVWWEARKVPGLRLRLLKAQPHRLYRVEYRSAFGDCPDMPYGWAGRKRSPRVSSLVGGDGPRAPMRLGDESVHMSFDDPKSDRSNIQVGDRSWLLERVKWVTYRLTGPDGKPCLLGPNIKIRPGEASDDTVLLASMFLLQSVDIHYSGTVGGRAIGMLRRLWLGL